MTKYSIKDLDLRGKTVFIRVDFNVPIKNGTITDDTRITASLPTIEYAIRHGWALDDFSDRGDRIGGAEIDTGRPSERCHDCCPCDSRGEGGRAAIAGMGARRNQPSAQVPTTATLQTLTKALPFSA